MKLIEKRRNYISKQQKVFKLVDRSWIKIRALHSNWSKCTSSFIKDMRCCRFCGFTKLHLQGTHFSVVPNTFGIVVGATLYGCSNIIMSTYTTISDGLHVYVCNACFKFYEQLEWIKCNQKERALPNNRHPRCTTDTSCIPRPRVLTSMFKRRLHGTKT